MAKIFYSWQSDNSAARNKFKRALEIAVKQIGKTVEEANRPELDSDTQNTFSSVNIVETIFKKIDECAVFIADVTPIAETDDKLIPNPNVMAEIGYALKTKSEHSLFVYCYDGERPERSMPFDIWSRNLIRVRTDDKPSEVAKELVRRIEGMLATANVIEEFPNIYVSATEFHRWSDGDSVYFTLRNAESMEYMLTAIEIEGKSAEPFRSLQATANTSGIVVNGVTKIFKEPNPLIKMTVQRGSKKFHLEQKILTVKGADEQNHFQRLVEQATAIRG